MLFDRFSLRPSLLALLVFICFSHGIKANQNPADRLSTTCSSCHNTSAGLSSFLTSSFLSTSNLEPNTTYRLTVSLPAQSDQFGINIDVDEVIDGVTQSQNDGEFVIALDNPTLIASISYQVGSPAGLTRQVGAGASRGNLADTYQSGQPVIQNFFWRSPPANAGLDGVRFRVQIVAGSASGSTKPHALQTITLGDVNSSGDDDDPDDDNAPPVDDADIDSNSAGAGGGFGGSFGCARLKTKENPEKSHERVLDLGFLFLVFLSLIAASIRMILGPRNV